MGQRDLPITLRLQQVLNGVLIQRQLNFRLLQKKYFMLNDSHRLDRAHLFLLFEQTYGMGLAYILLDCVT